MVLCFFEEDCMFYVFKRKISRFKSLILCSLITFITTYMFSLYLLSLDDCNCAVLDTALHNSNNKLANVASAKQNVPSHKLAVLVPFRDRFEELMEFVPYINKFLMQQQVEHQIYILNQVDKLRFNRASLINVGFKYASVECDYIAIHDVDLLPLNNKLNYSYPNDCVFHIASPELHPKYHYSTFVGGILLIRRDDFVKVNGMSNKYWGWGLEDDEFYVRLKDNNIQVRRPVNLTTGKENTFRHNHDRDVRKRDTEKCFNQREVTRRRDRTTGLDNVSYKITSVKLMSIDGITFTVLNVELNCNINLTPWCDCKNNVPKV